MPASNESHATKSPVRSSWRGCLRVATDEPGQRLLLVWQGWPPNFLLRNGLTLFILCFAITFFSVISLVTQAKLPPGWMFRFDILWRVAVVLGLFGGVAWFVSRQWFSMIGSHFGYWRSFDWDLQRGDFQAIYRGHFLGGGRTLIVPLTSIRGITATLPAAKQGRLPIELQFHPQGAAQRGNGERLQLDVEHLDQRPEALDLLFRIARVIGLQSYVVQESTLRTMKLKLLRSGPETKGTIAANREEDELAEGKQLSIPAANEPARYDLDLAPVGQAASPPKVPPFSLNDLKGQVELMQITTWEPGRRLHILRPGLPSVVWRILGFIGALSGAIVGGFLLAPQLPNPGWVTCLVSGIVGGIVALVLGAWIFREREVIFDWNNGQCWWREARWEHQLPFEEITACVLRGTTVTRTRNDSTSIEYRTDVLLETVYRTVLVIGTDGSSSDPDKPYRALVSFTANLADALHVPWRWDEYTSRAGRFTDIFRGSR